MNTVFVIGAGASKDLNGSFPVGPELAEGIERLLNNDLEPGPYGPISTALTRSSSGLVDDHYRAMTRIRDSILSQDSIDDFLSEWREVPLIDSVAKLAISYIILDAERKSALFIEAISDADRTARLREFNSTWLGRIVRRPGKPRRDVEAALEGISFIVFNYDRIIEQYLKLYLKFVIAKTDAEADDLLRNLSIIHAYGSLGEISQQSFVPFGAPDLFVAKAAEGIRTYNEGHPDEDVVRIRKTIDEADKIVFLGCAFHNQNLELLFGEAPTQSRAKTIHGTCFGVSSRRRDDLIRRLSKHGSIATFPAKGCSEFVKDTEDAIFGN